MRALIIDGHIVDSRAHALFTVPGNALIVMIIYIDNLESQRPIIALRGLRHSPLVY